MASISTGMPTAADVPKMAVKSLFMKYDEDGSGFICKAELRKLLEDLDLESHADVVNAVVDKNSDGKISFDEFFAWWKRSDKFKNLSGGRYEILVKAYNYFAAYDKDKSGSISIEEYKSLCKDLWGNTNNVETGLKALDADNSGSIEFQEFLNWLKWLD